MILKMQTISFSYLDFTLKICNIDNWLADTYEHSPGYTIVYLEQPYPISELAYSYY